VAEKVETREMFEETLELGYDLFQGYFFSKPTIVQAGDLRGYKLHYFEILQEINQSDLDFGRIEEIFKREMSLCYKLLRYINSVFFGWRNRVSSVRRAMILLGEQELKKWASFIILASMAEDKPDELLIQSVVRARFCEALAPMTGFADRSQDLFLMGMFSLIDAILDRSLEAILGELPIAEDVRDALLGEQTDLNRILCYARVYERGSWSDLERLTPQLGLPEEEVPALYLDALEWGTRTFSCSMAGDDETRAGSQGV
jgi:EAL and modified HD-GYP domain-containing signal transduction protein